MEPRKQTVEGDESGLAREDAVEARPQGSLALPARILAIGFKVAIERPDQSTNAGLGLALLIGEGVELVNETLGMNPEQAVLADIELTGVVTDNYRVRQKAMRLDASPQGSFAGNHDGIGIDFESQDAKPVEMRSPGCLIGEDPVGMFGQAGDHRPGERALAHICQCLGIDDIIVMAGAQQIEEVAAVL